jgi:MtrB/PioB family decaheme-associated outer membrane protein
MTRMSSLKAAAAASICLLPLHAFAQAPATAGQPAAPASATPADQPLTNWVTLGGQYQSRGSDYLGRFSGAVDPGFYFLGDFHYGYRDPWDSGGTNYFEMDGANMGMADRSFSAKLGQQGTWGVFFSYEGIPYNADPIQSVWQSTGALVPGVAPGSLPLNLYPNPAQFPAVTHLVPPFVTNPAALPLPAIFFPKPSSALAGSLYDDNIATQRNVFTGGGKYQLGDWTISATIRHENKTGYQANSLEIGGTVGLTGVGTGAGKNSPPAAGLTSGLGYFAQPIDYDTDRYDLTAAYSTDRLQVQLGYMFSNFKDNLSEFNAQNPFALGALAGSGNFSGTGATPGGITAPYALPPSNSAHQVSVMAGYNLSPTTRVNANFAYGLELQNDPYVTGSGNAASNPYVPRSSFDGLVQTFNGNVAVIAQPLPKLDVRLAYTIDDRDNQSPSNAYGVNTRSTATTSAGGDCAFTVGGVPGLCYNLPYSFEDQTFTGEAGYSILPHTKVSLNDTFETTYRNYADASFVTSNTVTAKVRSQLGDDLFGALSYSHQDRDAHNYVNGNTWAALTNGGVNPDTPSAFLVFFEASRKHDEVKGTLDYAPIHSVNTTLMVKFSNDNYPDTQNGLRNNYNFLIGPDVSWDISPSLTAHGYYTYQQVYYEQSSLYTSGSNFTTGNGYYVPWTNKTTDSVHTLGVTMDWQAIPAVLKFSVNYNFSYGDTAYALGDGMALIGTGQTTQTTPAALTLQALPDITSTLNMISIRGEYTFRPNMTVIFGYEFERFSYKDFMADTSATTYANALLPGSLNPNDSVQVVGAGLRVRF